jgi:CBS domain-containing protein
MHEMKVSEIMIRDPVMVDPDAPCGRLSKLMRNRGVGSVVVVKDGFPVGVVTERDLVHRILAEGRDPDKCVADQICTKPVVAISIYADVDMAVDMMNEYGIRRLVVVDEKDKLVGILTTDDIARNIRSMSEELAVKYMMLSRRKR